MRTNPDPILDDARTRILELTADARRTSYAALLRQVTPEVRRRGAAWIAALGPRAIGVVREFVERLRIDTRTPFVDFTALAGLAFPGRPPEPDRPEPEPQAAAFRARFHLPPGTLLGTLLIALLAAPTARSQEPVIAADPARPTTVYLHPSVLTVVVSASPIVFGARALESVRLDRSQDNRIVVLSVPRCPDRFTNAVLYDTADAYTLVLACADTPERATQKVVLARTPPTPRIAPFLGLEPGSCRRFGDLTACPAGVEPPNPQKNCPRRLTLEGDVTLCLKE